MLFAVQVYLILDEFILAGELQETSKKVRILAADASFCCRVLFFSLDTMFWVFEGMVLPLMNDGGLIILLKFLQAIIERMGELEKLDWLDFVVDE